MLQCLRNRFGRNTEAAARACACMQQSTAQNEKQKKTGCVVSVKPNDTARLPVITPRRGYWKTLFLSALLALPATVSAVTPPGTDIANIATATFDVGGVALAVNSNTVTLSSTLISTPSTIVLYQYDPSGAGVINEEVPTQFASSGPPGTGFVASPDPTIALPGVGATTLNPNLPISMNPVAVYHTGEPVFVWLQDLDQNLDPAVQETVRVTVTTSNGDQEELILTETDVNTGIFMGYVQSSSNALSTYDGVLTLAPETLITVNYVDQYDGSDASAASTLVDPFGIVFNSTDGTPIDNITVTLLDSIGNPATVYGDDGVSFYPNVITSGGSATDSGGAIYNFPAGGYRFPLLVPGDYQLVLSLPASLRAPSLVAIADLQVLPGAPFALDANASLAALQRYG